jgi:hypothetical protein
MKFYLSRFSRESLRDFKHINYRNLRKLTERTDKSDEEIDKVEQNRKRKERPNSDKKNDCARSCSFCYQATILFLEKRWIGKSATWLAVVSYPSPMVVSLFLYFVCSGKTVLKLATLTYVGKITPYQGTDTKCSRSNLSINRTFLISCCFCSLNFCSEMWKLFFFVWFSFVIQNMKIV